MESSAASVSYVLRVNDGIVAGVAHREPVGRQPHNVDVIVAKSKISK